MRRADLKKSFKEFCSQVKVSLVGIFQCFVSSDKSFYSDDVLNIYPSRQLFHIFTQSIDSIDVTSVTLSCLNGINAIDVTKCCVQMFNCSNVPMFQCFNVSMFQCFNVPIFQCSNVPMFRCSNVPMF